MQRVLTLTGSTVGKKVVMALTGVVLFGFVLAHLLGNLQLYMGPEAINKYAAFLHANPGLLWGARLVLLASVGLHIATAISLAGQNADARPSRYRAQQYNAATYASRTMYWSGPILLFFIVYHLAHLTFGQTPGYSFDRDNVYNNVVLGFQIWWIALVYIVGNIALGLHLRHGVWSLLQSLGVSHPRYDAWRERAAALFALFITLGNISFPVAVMSGWVEPTTELSALPSLMD
ncbi:MAG: succinate dehydrogenase cytochrome b subunit [Polyangiales bacterium]